MSEKHEHLEILDTQATAALIHRSEGAVRNLVMRRQIPFRKPAGRLVFLRSELERWIVNAPGLSLEELQSKRI